MRFDLPQKIFLIFIILSLAGSVYYRSQKPQPTTPFSKYIQSQKSQPTTPFSKYIQDTFFQQYPYKKKNSKALEITYRTIKLKNKNSIERYLMTRDKFQVVQQSFIPYTEPKKIAILYISTGRYIVFWEDFYKSMEKYFLPRHKKTYFLFTNHDDLKVADNVVKVHQDQLPWPYVTFKRFHFFDAIKEKLKEYDYIYFLNGDAKPVRPIDEEIFPTSEQELMVTLHSWYYPKNINEFPYERDPKSKSYIPFGNGAFYVTGAFNGGTRDGFLKMAETLKNWTDTDISNNVIPIWHDESMLNKYLVMLQSQNKKPLILFPEYVISEGYKYFALDEFKNYKMLLVNKDTRGGHNYLRGITN